MASSGTEIKGVMFDFHSTLVGHRDSGSWIEAATIRLESTSGRWQGLDPELVRSVAEHLDQIWMHAHTIDPENSRDLSAARHREIFIQAACLAPEIGPRLGEALYSVMADQWVAFDDTLPVLTKLAACGVRSVVVSNIGMDIRPFLAQAGLADKLIGVVLSYEVGTVKPQPEIFRHALRLLDVPPFNALMVGDSSRDDAGAAAAGIRTLLLPPTGGPNHGLESVLRLVGLPGSDAERTRR